jgi:hypothetical protein
MKRPTIEVADIVRRRGKQFLERFKAVLSYQQLKAYRAVKRCRTAALGGHRDTCEDCTYEAPFSYNSCRSRCCPKCQAQARRRWLQIQQRDLLNTSYFHVVFTLPHELNPLALTSRRPLLELLFDASSQTLLEVAADPKRLGAEIGFLSILHTWGSNVSTLLAVRKLQNTHCHRCQQCPDYHGTLSDIARRRATSIHSRKPRKSRAAWRTSSSGRTRINNLTYFQQHAGQRMTP